MNADDNVAEEEDPVEAAKESKRLKKGARSTYLVADTREGAVIPFIETVFRDHAYVARQINTGDYLICKANAGADPTILACVERKTYTDFGASLKDGRYANIKKMRALRERTGCQLYFFVEGPAFPRPDRHFSRIPFRNIEAAITKLMLRDGIYVINTENESHTAKRLLDLVGVFEEEAPHRPAPAPAEAAAGPEQLAEPAELAELAADALAVPESLTSRPEQEDDDAAVTMWARLRGVNVVLGKILTRKFSVAELAAGTVSMNAITEIKTGTGRPIHQYAVSSLRAVRGGSNEQAIKLISGLRNVTPAVATLIIKSVGSLAALCNTPTAALAMIMLPQATREVKLGTARAERIRRMLHYREGAPPPAEPAGPVLGGAGPRTKAKKPKPPASPAKKPAPPPEPEPEPDEDEAPSAPLTDADVTDLLAEAGFDI